jgi:hypothetical protein
MPSDECEELAIERDVQSPPSPQALIQKALNKKSPKSHSNYRFLADYEDLTLMAKRRTEGTDWYHIRKWAIGAKAEMEQEDIDSEFFDLARQYMSLSGLRKVPDHVALPDDIALWNQDSMFPSQNGKVIHTVYVCPMRHLCGCMAGFRLTKNLEQGWMKMDICGHDETSHASKPRKNTSTIRLESDARRNSCGECSNQ